MAALKVLLMFGLLQLTAVTAQSLVAYNGTYSATTPNNAIFTSPVAADPCTIGPSYWCLSEANMRRCEVYGVSVGVCGYR